MKMKLITLRDTQEPKTQAESKIQELHPSN